MSRQSEMTTWYTGLGEYILSAPHLAPLHDMFQFVIPQFYSSIRSKEGSESEEKDASNLQVAYLLMIRMKEWFFSPLPSFMHQAIGEYVRQKLRVPSVAADPSPQVVKSAETFSKLGHVALPMISSKKISDMKNYFERMPLYRGQSANGGTPISIEEARTENFASYPIDVIFGCPHLLEIANDPMTLSIVERYLGAVPIVLGYLTWWSFANDEDPISVQLFHQDGDDYRFCKMFIYLTDVTLETGPHAFIERSHDQKYITELRQKFNGGADEFVNWYMNVFRKSDDDVKRIFGVDPALLTGPAGTSFLADTQGIHKGTIPKNGDRLVCQVLYGVSPNAQVDFTRLSMGTPATEHLPSRLAEQPYCYINQLFIEPPKVSTKTASDTVDLKIFPSISENRPRVS